MTDAAPGPYRIHVNAPDAPAVAVDLLERAVAETLRGEGVDRAEVSLTLLDDEAMAGLNHRWLGRSGTTDVLSFSLGEEDEPPLGDVYLGREQAVRQAHEHGRPLEEELVRLAVHGTLHVLGHDHPEGPERGRSPMFRRQEELVRAVLGAAGAAAGRTPPSEDGGTP